MTVTKAIRGRVFLLVAMLSASCSGIATSRSEGDITLANVNLKRQRPDVESPAGYGRRARNVAQLLSAKFASWGQPSHAVALAESYYTSHNPATRPSYHNAEKIPCPPDDEEVWTERCFVSHLGGAALSGHSGDVAFLANSGKFTGEGGLLKSRLDSYDPAGFGSAIEYDIVGHRLRTLGAKGSKGRYVIPFYSVHLPTGDSPVLNRKAQLNSLLRAVRGWWKFGDLTPIVVGDFNFDHSDDELGEMMREHFVEAGMVKGGRRIEGIWIGKESTFVGSAGVMTFTEYGAWPEFDDFHDGGPRTLADHQVTYARVRPLFWTFHKKLLGDPTASTDHGPLLFSTDDALWAVWTDGQAVWASVSADSEPTTFSQKQLVRKPGGESIRTLLRPSIVSHNGRKVIAWIGTEGFVHVMTRNDAVVHGAWAQHRKLNHESDASPALAVVNGRFVLAWKKESESDIFVTSSADGLSWTTPTSTGVKTDGAPTLAALGTRLFMGWIGDKEHNIHVMHSDDQGKTWAGKVKLRYRSEVGPSLLAVPGSERIPSEQDGQLYLTWSAASLDSQRLHVQILSSRNGVDWGNAARGLQEQTLHTPVLAYYRTRFVLGWTDWLNLLKQAGSGYVNVRGTQLLSEVSIDTD